jgi:hypothetical protein
MLPERSVKALPRHEMARLGSSYVASIWAFLHGVAGCDADPAPRQASAAPVPSAQQQVKSEKESLFGRPDEPSRRTLATAKVERVTQEGGRSLAFRLWFEGHVQGIFKPEPTFAANSYSELASYYLDRELALGRVPPAIGRRIEWERLRPHAAHDHRLDETVVRAGIVRGSVVWWIPTALEPIDLPAGWESWLRLESTSHPSPFERPELYLKLRHRDAKASAPQASTAAGRRASRRAIGLHPLRLPDRERRSLGRRLYQRA